MDRWRNCKNPPSHGFTVLLLVDGDYYVGWWDEDLEGGHWYVPGMNAIFDMNPTHWMPLPDRPRGVKEPEV